MKAKKISSSFKYAFTGIKTAVKSERNMKIHIIVMLIVIIAGIFFHISIIEWIICTLLFALVIAGEMFNTAIETVVNMAMPRKNELAGKAKDIAAGAVLLFAIAAAIIGMMIFLPKIIAYFS